MSRAQVTSSLWVDDTAPAIIYSPAAAWGAAVDPGLGLYMNTYHFSVTSDALNRNATVVYTFPQNGTGFTWQGMQNADAGLFAVCIDCNSSWIGTDFQLIDGVNASATDKDSPTTLYSTSGLSNTIHNVTICNMLDARTNKYGQLTVDSFVIQLPAGASALPSTTGAVAPGFLTISTTSVDASATAAAMAPWSNDSSSSPKLSRGQIAGIVVGAVLALLLLVILIIFCSRGRSRGHSRPPPPTAQAPPPSPVPGGTATPNAPPRTAFGLSLFNNRKDPKEPTPFILPTMSELPGPAQNYPYLHSSVPPAIYPQSINPPTEVPSPAQSPVSAYGTKEEEAIRRWPSISTSSEEELPRNPTATASVSSLAGSIMSSIRLPRRKQSTPMTTATPSNNIRLQPTAPVTQPPNPRNTRFFIANASPAPRPIPEETLIPPIPPISDWANEMRLPPPALSSSNPPSSMVPTTSGRTRSMKTTPPRVGKRAMGPRPLSAPQPPGPSGPSRQQSG